MGKESSATLEKTEPACAFNSLGKTRTQPALVLLGVVEREAMTLSVNCAERCEQRAGLVRVGLLPRLRLNPCQGGWLGPDYGPIRDPERKRGRLTRPGLAYASRWPRLRVGLGGLAYASGYNSARHVEESPVLEEPGLVNPSLEWQVRHPLAAARARPPPARRRAIGGSEGRRAAGGKNL